MPIDYKKYPSNWMDISRRIRIERAKGRCEFCGAPNGVTIYRNPHDLADYATTNDGVKYTKPVKVVLTVAHLDHDITNNSDDNLKALCQLCHLRYDAQHHATNAKKTRARNRRAGQMTLFGEDEL